MEILRFIKWWWYQRESVERFWTAFAAWAIISFLLIFPLGILAVVVWLAGIFLVMVGALMLSVFRSVQNQWNKFQEAREREAQQILRRLGGK